MQLHQVYKKYVSKLETLLLKKSRDWSLLQQ